MCFIKNLGILNLILYLLSLNIQFIINYHTIEVHISLFLNINILREKLKTLILVD